MDTNSTKTTVAYCFIYRTRAIITRGLHIFYPIFVIKYIYKENWAKNPKFIIKSVFKSRAASNQEQRVYSMYLNKFEN